MTKPIEKLDLAGWAGLRQGDINHEALRQQMMVEAQSEAAIVAACFATPAGHACLDWLVAKTLMRPPSDQEFAATSVEQYALLKARREGQNGVIYMILNAIATAKGTELVGGDQ